MNCSTNDARLTALYADHARPLSRFLAGFTVGSPYGVEDLLQETMIRAWRRIEDVPAEPQGARRWLFAVAVTSASTRSAAPGCGRAARS